jgi:hypothetical protein
LEHDENAFRERFFNGNLIWSSVFPSKEKAMQEFLEKSGIIFSKQFISGAPKTREDDLRERVKMLSFYFISCHSHEYWMESGEFSAHLRTKSS